MRIAIILPGGVDRSGVDRVIPSRLWLLERLARRHDVHVFATDQEAEPSSWDLLGARVHATGTARGRMRRLLAAVGAEHSRARFDVLHAFFGWSGARAAVVSWRYRIGMVFHPSGGEFLALHDVGYGMRSTLGGRIGLRMALAAADRVTVASEPMRRLAADVGVDADVVPLGVALDRWPVCPPRPRDFSRPIRLLHVGDLRPVKDQTMLLRAAVKLRDAGIDFVLDIVGLDTLDGQLQKSQDAISLGERARWHGSLRREPLRTLMEKADLLVVTSRHEAGPLVVLEAAIAGTPTVGTAVGHVAEFAPNAAVSVPVGDADALAHEIASLADDDSRRMSLAREAQRRAVAIDADHTAATFEQIYREVSAAPT